MPNWTSNLVKVFIPENLESLVRPFIAAMADPGISLEGVDFENPSDAPIARWFDFERILPLPAALKEANLPDWHYLPKLLQTEWKKWGSTVDEAVAALRESNPKAASDLETFYPIYKKYRATNYVDIVRAMWGVKWNASECEAPKVSKTEEIEWSPYPPGCYVITWYFQTPWYVPENFISAFMTVCEHLGFGARWWFSHEDVGQQWNPFFEEMETVWTSVHSLDEIENGEPDPEPLPFGDYMTLLGNGFQLDKLLETITNESSEEDDDA